MHFQQLSINGEDFIGLFGLATDSYALLSVNFPKIFVLDVPEIRTKIYGSGLIGLFCAGNSNGLLLPYFVSRENLSFFKKSLKDVNIALLNSEYTAIGNLIACNDKAAIVSDKLDKKDIDLISNVLNVEVFQRKISEHSEVGSCCVATNKGFIAHWNAENEIKELEEIFKVPGSVSTVNFGFPFPRAGIIANSNGYIVGKTTSGIELGRIDEALGFL
ncbi:MAG: translation initiation factor IF-6 [Candidatus Altiarchaeota archaeon]